VAYSERWLENRRFFSRHVALPTWILFNAHSKESRPIEDFQLVADQQKEPEKKQSFDEQALAFGERIKAINARYGIT